MAGLSRVPNPTTGSMYCSPHLGDPCTLDSLDHILGCGHKAVTLTSQPCATNCHIRPEPDNYQIRDLDHSFICVLCIAEHIQSSQIERAATYVAELEGVARVRGKDGEWVRERLNFVQARWRDQDVEEMKMLLGTRGGMESFALWVEPEIQVLLDVAIAERRLGGRNSRSTLISTMSSKASTMSSLADADTTHGTRPQIAEKRLWYHSWLSPASMTVEPTLEAPKTVTGEEAPAVNDERTTIQPWHQRADVRLLPGERRLMSGGGVYE